METIKNIEQLKENINTLESMLMSDNPMTSDYARDLIIRGHCFVSYQKDGILKFAPSRFIGYVNNSMRLHLENEKKSGLKTNPVINKILKSKPVTDIDLEKHYVHYFNYLGCDTSNNKPYKTKRKYWELK